MKLESQVVSLDLAKRLKELGVKQESYFFWTHLSDRSGYMIYDAGRYGTMFDAEDCFAAITVAELIQILGADFGRLEYNTFSEYKTGVPMYFAYEKNEMRNLNTSGQYPQDALAELIIKLKQGEKTN